MNKKEKDTVTRESEMKYRQLVEDANSIILSMDVKGRVTFLNKFAQRFFGFKESEIVGRSVIGTIVPVTDSAGRDLIKMIADIGHSTKKYISNENENILRSGERVWIAWTNRLIFDQNRRRKEIVCIGNDITKIKKAEEVLREMDRRKSVFVANVAHEFKNPLAVIRESTAFMLEGRAGNVSQGQREMLEMGKRNVERLIRLVTDILDISKIEAGKMELKKENVKLSSLMHEAVSSNSAEISKKRLSIKTDVSKEKGLIRADKDKLTEVMINLLSNAIKYTPPGGRIKIKFSGTRKEVRFEISDTGPGIAEKDLEKIFDKFERIITNREEGTGLGLSICKDIIDLHKGDIWVESEPGKGSRFIFTLPRS